MLVMMTADLAKPEALSNQEFFEIWRQESVAAIEAYKAGAIKAIWKVAGEYQVIAVFEVENGDQIDDIIQLGGESVDVLARQSRHLEQRGRRLVNVLRDDHVAQRRRFARTISYLTSNRQGLLEQPQRLLALADVVVNAAHVV